MKTLFAIVLTLGLLASAGFAQPTITGVQNAASNALPPLPNSGIALGSFFAIYGTGLGPSTAAEWNPYPLPQTLGNASISVTVGGTTVAAYPEYVSAGQINAVLPSNTLIGTGTITVTYNGTTSAAFPITVVATSFGTFSWNSAGTGPGIFTNAVTNVLASPFTTVKPGDYVTIWGTGLGAATGNEASGPPTQVNACATPTSCPVTVWVANQQAQVTYAGRSGYTAVDQIDFIVPNSAQGCYVQVAVETGSSSGSTVSNFTSISVDGTGPTCSDADGINYADMANLLASKGGNVNVGAISLLSNYLNLNIPLLGGELQWDNDTVSGEIATISGYQLDAFQGFTLSPSVNNCTVSPFLQYPPPTDPILGGLTYLDAGSSLSIAAPVNGTQPVPKNKNGKGYSGVVGGATIANLLGGSGINPFFLNATGWGTTSWTYSINPGTYTITDGSGGSNVGSMSAAMTVPTSAQTFQWTNQSTVTAGAIPRNSPLTINWSGGDPNGYVDITAVSSTEQAAVLTPSATTPGILIECIAPVSAGSFTIPTYVLQSLPSTVGSQSTVPPGELLVGPASAACSSLGTSADCPTQLTAPSGLDALYIFYHLIQGSNVSWN